MRTGVSITWTEEMPCPGCKMPLAIVCGLPCAGKTAVSLRLKGLIEERYPEYSVSLINDESLSLCKASGYESSAGS